MTSRKLNPYESSTFENSLLLRVDGAIGAMSLSPNGRDAVLAGRRGLFIIDLDDPFTPPRWLHHITSWEVADVQWSPHHFVKPSWCISTSNQKALLWDLKRPSSNAIASILHSHNRAISDINFHPFDPEILATCAVDSFIMSWDMRAPRKPVAKWAEWRAGASQVKWNHENPNEIALCHDSSFYIWDTRKGALPVVKIEKAHEKKINGIDFTQGLKNIANRVYGFTTLLANEISKKHQLVNNKWFDTLTVKLNGVSSDEILAKALNEYDINMFRVDESRVSLQLDETVQKQDLINLVNVFTGQENYSPDELPAIPQELLRSDEILTNEVFNAHHSETAMLRYLHSLQRMDLSLADSMIPLGSCTMKLNATVEMQTLSIPGFNSIHPFAPIDQAQGYKELIDEFEKDLNDITGFDGTTSMPNSGAQGEYTGLSLIREYHRSRGEHDQRNICLIPVSAHGTNPASAAMCGLKVVPVKCLSNGSIDLEDLEAKAAKHAKNLCSIMITYPSTYGLFEPGVKKAIDIVHANGGLVYLDGANMNAQVGLTSPGDLGADVCHLNIHKTFALSHGGGGPGQAPVCVKEHLKPFLPKHHFVNTPHSTSESIKAVNSAPYGSASVIPVSYSYIKMLGAQALPYVSAIAMLNANYILTKLEPHYKILFVDRDASSESGTKHCAHEFILDLREFQKIGIEAIDVAKRLQDYGFHAPTMSFPVAGTLMIEPTESENLRELDRFIDSLISIRKEIEAYQNKEPLGQVLKNAPHSLEDIVSSEDWDARGYTREQAAYPLPFLKKNKCWPTVSRLNDTYGDLNLICTCPSVEEVAAES